MRLPSTDWIIGFIEGEGNFHVSLSNFKGKKNYPFDYYPLLQFRIFLREDDFKTLKKIKRVIGLGKIYKKNYNYSRKKGIRARDQYVYYITRLEDLFKLENFLKKGIFHSKKKDDMSRFFDIARIKAYKKHLTKKGYEKVIKLANSMNGKSRANFRV